MKFLNAIFVVIAAVVFVHPACERSKVQQPDQGVEKLRQEFQQLSDDNKELKDELVLLRKELELQRRTSPQTRPQTALAAVEASMNVEKMKADLQPLLPAALQRAKQRLETSRTDQQFGMRVEYDLNRAIYGLVENRDETVPYTAKVIVPYEKFLESGRSSKSYGLGTTTILFAYVDKTWELRSLK